MTLKQAIMKLPDVDKRWKGGYNDEDDNISQMIIGGKQKLYLATNSSIDDFHAAAKTLGYEIWWEPNKDWQEDGREIVVGYNGYWHIIGTATTKEMPLSKTPAKAIQAAFIWCVEQKVRGLTNATN